MFSETYERVKDNAEVELQALRCARVFRYERLVLAVPVGLNLPYIVYWYIVHRAGQHCKDALSRLCSGKPTASGLKWRNAGTTEPDEGTPVKNDPLAKALKKKAEFTKEELEDFGIKDLRSDHYIESGDSYFTPDIAAWEGAAGSDGHGRLERGTERESWQYVVKFVENETQLQKIAKDGQLSREQLQRLDRKLNRLLERQDSTAVAGIPQSGSEVNSRALDELEKRIHQGLDERLQNIEAVLQRIQGGTPHGSQMICSNSSPRASQSCSAEGATPQRRRRTRSTSSCSTDGP